jgi:cell wall assembly regulator SMI1
LWDRLEAYLREYAPPVLATLNPPATDAQIRAAEQRLERKLPADLIASLKVHDGQREERAPLIPAEHDKRRRRIATWGEPASLEVIVRATLVERGLFERAPGTSCAGPCAATGNGTGSTSAPPARATGWPSI